MGRNLDGIGPTVAAFATMKRPRKSANRAASDDALDHHFLDLCDGFRRIQTLWAGLGAVHDRVAAIEFERIFKIVEPFTGCLVAAVDDPAVGVQKRGRS